MIVLTLVAFFSFCAAASDTGLTRFVDGLANENKAIRETALAQLSQMRVEFGKKMVALLDKARAIDDHAYGGFMHCAIVTSGNWSLTETVPMLVDVIDFELVKGSFPSGDKLPISAYFPATEALIKIGGIDVMNRLVSRIAEAEKGGKTVKACLWTLCQLAGEKMARSLINDAIAKERILERNSALANAVTMIDSWRTLLLDVQNKKTVE
jgi:hypothetical protein